MTPLLPLLSCAGLALGSFATVVAHRVPRGESIVGGRSRCPGCGATIAAYDNVPVLSWLLLRGRCRRCGERISARYPLTELAMAVAVRGHGPDPRHGRRRRACPGPRALHPAGDDHPHRPRAARDPQRGPAGRGRDRGGDRRRHRPGRAWPSAASRPPAAGGFLLCVALVYPRGMGMGDVKLVAVMGLYLGRAVAPALLIAFAAGALVGLVLIAAPWRRGAQAARSPSGRSWLWVGWSASGSATRSSTGTWTASFRTRGHQPSTAAEAVDVLALSRDRMFRSI